MGGDVIFVECWLVGHMHTEIVTGYWSWSVPTGEGWQDSADQNDL